MESLQSVAPADGDIVLGVRGVLVKMGLARPEARAFVAATAVGLVTYALGLPARSFTEEGDLRPFKGTSASPHATYTHFLALPVAAGVATYVFT